MQIDSIQLYRLPLPLPPPLPPPLSLPPPPAEAERSIAPQTPWRQESVLVEMRSGRHLGLGEASLSAAPGPDGQWAAGALACLRDWLAPAVVGRAIDSPEALQRALAEFGGNPAARSALDMAWWNLWAAASGQPLCERLGGSPRGMALAAKVPRTDSIETLLREVGNRFEEGFELAVLEFRPGWDLEVVRAVRQHFPTEPVAIDGDGCCTLGQQQMFYRLEDFFLTFIEQPLAADDLVGHAMLRESLRTPICLDQSVASPQRVEQILDIGAASLVRVDPARVGGLSPALAIGALCAEAGTACGLECGGRGPVAAGAAAALAALPRFSGPASWQLPLATPGLEFDAASWLSRQAPGPLLLDVAAAGAGVTARLERAAAAALERATVG